MYSLLLWDKGPDVNDHDRLLKSTEVPINLARKFFSLEPKNFPILSSLSLDDYDLFSDDQLVALRQELETLIGLERFHNENIDRLLDLINEAEAKSKSVMFDPFR